MNEVVAKRDWFYWFMAILTLIQIVVSVIFLLDFLIHPIAQGYNTLSEIDRFISIAVFVPLGTWLSILVIRRMPTNVTGLFLLQWTTTIVAGSMRVEPNLQVLYGFAGGWLGLWFLPLFFPDGRIYPQRLEKPIRFLIVLSIMGGFILPFSSPIMLPLGVANPYFVTELAGIFPLLNFVDICALLLIAFFMLPSIVLRYRHSDYRVKQQLKWFAWVFFVLILSSIFVFWLGISRTGVDPRSLNVGQKLIQVAWSNYITLSPFIAVAYAILRHKLYDIDIIIRRTLIYSILSAILAGIYFGTVILVQQVFQSATGEVPDFAIVLSTLLIAALFTPIRNAVQAQIDRRFYRRKYDVEQTLADFQQNLREEVDMPTLQANLVTVVNETMQPSSIRLWIKQIPPS